VFFGKKFLYILALFLALFLTFPRFASADYAQREKEDAVLNNADECFKAMQNEDFTKVWSLLSSKSKSQIIDSVYKGLLKANITAYTKKDIEQDFSVGGSISKSFWSGYLKNFSPKMVLDESVWEKVEFDGDKAKIVIKYKKATVPFDLKMYKENNEWKVGLIETFGM